MSEPEWLLQVSTTLSNGTMINVRGQNTDDIEHHLDELITISAKLANFKSHIQGTTEVAAQLGGQVTDHYSSAPSSPAPSGSAPQAQGAAGGALETVTDKWDNMWTYNHPSAPMTPRGPAVLKSAKSRDDKPYKRFEDPAKGPKWYADHGRDKPSDADMYPGEFFND